MIANKLGVSLWLSASARFGKSDLSLDLSIYRASLTLGWSLGSVHYWNYIARSLEFKKSHHGK